MDHIQPRDTKDDEEPEYHGYTLNLLKPNIYQFESNDVGSNVYLLIGDRFNVLIDSGLVSSFESFNNLLSTEIGLSINDINIIINTHAHFDHISSNCFFPQKCLIAAHRWTATMIQHDDELITKAKKHSLDITNFKIPLWLEDRCLIDLGNVRLKVVETPGHTAGSICLYEPDQWFIFTGDTLFKEIPANIYESGSISQLISSLQILRTLRIELAFPGHGPCMLSAQEVEKAIHNALFHAQKNLQTFIDNVKSKSVKDVKIPSSLYNRKEEDL